MTTVVDYEFRSELLRDLAAKHTAQGHAEGEAEAVLIVLDTRGITVPDPIREQILTCTDPAQLNTWLRRAVTATTAEQVIHG